MLGQHLQHRPLQPDPPDLGPQGTVQIGRGPAPPVIATPLQGGVAAKGMPKSAQAVQVEPAAQQPGRVGGQLLELVGHRGQVGGLVVADRGPLGELLLGRSGLGLGAQQPGHRRRAHRDDPAVGEDCHRALVGVVHAHHDITVAGQFLGGGRQQQGREPALGLHEHRVARLLVGHRSVGHGVAAQPGSVQAEELAGRRPRLG